MELPIRYTTETVSNSGLAALSVSPRMYRNYKDRVETATASYFNLGSATHCMVLEKDEFDDRYMVSTAIAPTGYMAAYIDSLFRNRCRDGEYEGLQKSNWIINAHADSGYKWSSDKVWENFNNDPNLIGYYETLLATKDKIVLSTKDKVAIDACVDGIQTHERAAELLYGYILSDVYNELNIVWKHPKFPKFKMRSIFDRVIIDTATKTAILVDLKTTSKSVNSFKYSYRKYNYHRQMALYRLALKWYLEDLGHDSTDWTFEIYIVATQTNGYGDTAVYAPSEADLIRGEAESDKLLERMSWHFDNDKWDQPMEYYLNNGVIILNLDDEQGSQFDD